MKRLLILLITIAALAVMLTLALGAGASSDKRFLLSWRGSFMGPSSGTGTFAVGGALSDSGTFNATFTATPGKDNCAVVVGNETFTSTNGAFSANFSGLSCPASPTDPRAPFDGHFTITGGSGAYTGLSGKGTITSLADFSDGTFTGVHDGTAHLASSP
jgi:hypothetical protein